MSDTSEMNDQSEALADDPPVKLADRYAEVRRFRTEAFQKYAARELSVIGGPPVSLTLPKVAMRTALAAKKTIGPLAFFDTPPVLPFVEKILRQRARTRILEIGPGGGELALDLNARFEGKIDAYFGFDRDASVRGAFTRVDSIAELPSGIDLVIASEVIEHMSADELFTNILVPLKSKLSHDATIILSTPNPTSPGGIARDFSHVQNYPWYDLYALFRLAFARVDVYRAFYAYSARQLLLLLPRIVLCFILEMEWTNGLVCVATLPRVDASPNVA